MGEKTGRMKTVRFGYSFNLCLFIVAACLLGLLPSLPAAWGADANAAAEEPGIRDEDKLPGVLYDLKLTSDGMPTRLMASQDGKQFNRLRTALSVWNLPDTSGKESVVIPFLKRFVLSNWPYKTDSAGNLYFREFNLFSRSSVTPYRSFFYQPFLSSDTAPKSFSNDSKFSPGVGWVGIHAGYVMAPFTGKFRFVGYGNDALVVRFDNQLVLDYGCYALSIGKKLDDTWDFIPILSGTAARTDPQKRMVLENPIYSKCKLDLYSASMFDKHGMAKGVPVSVIRGQCYPIEILVSDIEQNRFCMALFAERLDSDGNPLKENPVKLPLFRTTSELPGHSSDSSFPDFDEDSPIWKVVDAKGKPIPSRSQAAVKAENVTDPKKDSQEKPSSAQESNPKKSVTKTRNGNVITETAVEQNGDTTIETVTTTEANGDTTVQTKVVTESIKGVPVKKTTTTSTSVVVEFYPDASPAESPRQIPEKKEPASSGKASSSETSGDKTPSSTEKGKHNPFGYTRPPEEAGE